MTRSSDETACIWSLSTGEKLLGPLEHDNWVVAAKFSPDGRLIATATWHRDSVRVYDSHKGSLLVDFPVKTYSLFNQSLAWASNSRLLFALSCDSHIHHFDVSAKTMLLKWCIHSTNSSESIALASNGTFLATSADSLVSLWDTTTHKQIGAVITYTHSIWSMAISSNYDLVTGGGHKITLRELCGFLPSHYIPCMQKIQTQVEKVDNSSNESTANLKQTIQELRNQLATSQQTARQERDNFIQSLRAHEESLNGRITRLGKSIQVLRGKLAESQHAANKEKDDFNETINSLHANLCTRDNSSSALRIQLANAQCRADGINNALEQMHQCKSLYAQDCIQGAAECLLETANSVDDGVRANKIIVDWLTALERVGDNALNADKCNEAIAAYSTTLSLGPTIPNTIVFKWANMILIRGSTIEALSAAIKFKVPRFVIYRVICDILEWDGRLAETIECFQQMQSELPEDAGVHDERAEWELDFKACCMKELEQSGDVAMDSASYEDVAAHYSTALSLDPISAILLTKQSKAQAGIGSWEDLMFKFRDILREFETRVLLDMMKSFFRWWEDLKKLEPSSREAKDARAKFCKEFPSRGVILSHHGVKIALKNLKYFTFFPLPDDLSPSDNIYIEVTPAGVPTRGAMECFSWAQLSLLNWLKYACAQAQQFPLNGDPDWNEAADLLKDIKCIPTSMGLRLPADSYFDQADICRDLPVAKGDDFLNIPVTCVADKGGSRYMLVSQKHVQRVFFCLRVRPMMKWKDMVERLETAASEESNDRFLRFLVLIYGGRLTVEQINEIKKKRIFYSKNHGQVSVTQLHLPNEDTCKLGLLMLACNCITSLQGAVDPPGLFAVEPFIESLGIWRYLTLNKIIELATSDELEIQWSTLQYLLLNLETFYDAYKPDEFADIAFIPTESGPLACPNEVTASPVWERLGFKQASKALHRDLSRLGVKDDPSVETIIEYFKIPECTLPDLDTATTWFEHLYLYGRFPIPKLCKQLSIIPFVPVKSPKHLSSELSPEPSPIEYFPPNKCFITSPNMEKHEHYRSIFPFVDFGQNGNSFLESCCAKKSPDASDIIRKIV
ncbi:hypothetical protein HD554DRAFT_2169413 [Boletus coccyginus]|nr:hypothetical protein HD554DRAFT_2169413 [Boletus coccyginus]